MNRPLVGLSVYFRHTMKHGDQIAPHFGKKNWKMQKSFSWFFWEICLNSKKSMCLKNFKFLSFWICQLFCILTIFDNFVAIFCKKNYPEKFQKSAVVHDPLRGFSIFTFWKNCYFDHYFWSSKIFARSIKLLSCCDFV